MNQSNQNPRTACVRSLRGPFASVPCFVLVLAASGCTERHEIGHIGQGLDPGEAETGGVDIPVIIDGPEDADALLDSPSGAGVGDIDGDGYGDWMSGRYDDWMSGLHLAYGRSRPADGVVTVPLTEGPTFVLGAAGYFNSPRPRPAGDIDGDGYEDIVFATDMIGHERYPQTAEQAAAFAESATANARRLSTQRAFLWYGTPDRSPGERDLGAVAVALGDRDDLVSRFQTELIESGGPGEDFYQDEQHLEPVALGDIDGDGYADLGVTVTLTWGAIHEEQQSYGISQVATRKRSESVSYIYYGRSQRLAGGEPPDPDVRLPGVSALQAIGDVNGDGRGDLAAITAHGTRLVPGGLQRLSAAPSLDDVAVPLSPSEPYGISAIGDLDGDGFDDLIVLWERGDEANQGQALIYGSPQRLQRPVDEAAASAMFIGLQPLTELLHMGDWDGDGWTDVLIMQHRFTAAAQGDGGFASSEVRLIPGSPERYAGTHELPVFPPLDPSARHSVQYPQQAGDIDGDGLADLFFSVATVSGTTLPYYVRYGGALPPTRSIH